MNRKWNLVALPTARPTARRAALPRPGAAALITALCVLLVGAELAARPMSIDQCVQMAVRRNPTLLSKQISVQIAQTDIQSTFGPFDWLLNAQVSFGYNDTPSFSRFDAGADPNNPKFTLSRTEDLDWGVSVSKRFVTGTKVELSFVDSYVYRSSSIYLRNRWFTGMWRLSATQSFLKGFGLFTNQAETIAARKNKDIETLRKIDAVNQVILDTVNAYWELVYAQEDLQIKKSALEVAKVQERDTDARVKAGQLTETDLLTAKHLVAQREVALLTAENALTTARETLRKVIGTDVLGPDTVAVDKPTPITVQAGLKTSLEKTMSSNYGLLIYKRQLDRQRVLTRKTRQERWPSLDLSVSVGQNGLGVNYGRSLESLFKFKAGYFEVMLNFSYPLNNDVAKANYRRNQLLEQKIDTDAEVLRRELSSQVSKAVRNLDLSQRRVRVTDVLLRLATRKLETANELLKLGKMTFQDHLQHQQELEDARVQRLRALVDVRIAQAQIQALRAELLARFRVEVR